MMTTKQTDNQLGNDISGCVNDTFECGERETLLTIAIHHDTETTTKATFYLFALQLRLFTYR